MSPFKATYGFDPIFHIDLPKAATVPPAADRIRVLQQNFPLLKNTLLKSQQEYKKYADRRRLPAPSYQVGEKVWLSSAHIKLLGPAKKLNLKYLGPFEIIALPGPNAVHLRLPPSWRLHPTFHVSLLKKWHLDTSIGRRPSTSCPTYIDISDEFEVDSILDSRVRLGRLEYLVEWKGYGPEERSWEPESNIHAPIRVRAFHRRYPDKPAPNRPRRWLVGRGVCRDHGPPRPLPQDPLPDSAASQLQAPSRRAARARGLRLASLVLAAAVSLLGGLIFGYELGIISGALLQLKNAYYLTCFQQEALVGSILVGMLLSSLFGGIIIDRSGRRTAMLSSNLVVLLGSIILILASTFLWLVIGRVIIGIAISISSMACCIYVSEIVRPHQRGKLVSLYETGIAVGILLSYAMNYFLANVNQGWKYMFGLAITPATVQFICILFLPKNQEMVNGLIQMKDIDGAEDVLPVPQRREYSFIDLFSSKDNMRARTIVGLGLVLFQQLTGQPNVLFYASTIFHSVGFQSNSSAVLASVILGFVKVLATLVAMSCADKAGRRKLLLAGCILMTLSITGIGLVSFTIEMDPHKDCEPLTKPNVSRDLSNSSVTFNSIDDLVTSLDSSYSQVQQRILVTRAQSMSVGTGNHTPLISTSSGALSTDEFLQSSKGLLKRATTHSASTKHFNNYIVLNWIILLCMMVFVSAFSIGFGPMTWLVLSEIFPSQIRGRAFAFCNSFNWAANLLISLSFLNVIASIGLSWTFLSYGMIGVAAIVFIYCFVPETKGRSLEEINKQFLTKRLTGGNQMWERFTRRRLSDPEYQIMGRSNTSISSISSNS
ncbi:solute carrier family 2, facilitated glucose transporter member 10 [Pelodytes ibericus]